MITGPIAGAATLLAQRPKTDAQQPLTQRRASKDHGQRRGKEPRSMGQWLVRQTKGHAKRAYNYITIPLDALIRSSQCTVP